MYSPHTINYTKSDDLDVAFRATLDEIRASYRNLDKQSLKIRVEKWCSKLVSTGSTSGNRIFSKHRNDYAKLLLFMVNAKKLEEPYDTAPPEGPLPSFPNHLRMYIRDSSQERENSFWNNLKDNLNQSRSKKVLSPKTVGSGSGLKGRQSGGTSGKLKVQTTEEWDRKELFRLNALVRDQDQRITLLEQQLRDERLKHEIEKQKLRHEHRIEMSKLESKTGNGHVTSLNSSKSSVLMSRRQHFTEDSENGGDSFMRRSSQVMRDLVQNGKSALSNMNFFHTGDNFVTEDDEENQEEGGGGAVQEEEDERPRNDRQNDSETLLSASRYATKNTYRYSQSSEDSEDMENMIREHNQYSRSPSIPTGTGLEEDEEFLNYIDKFQEEIRRSVDNAA